jgi:hypothetical protein
MKKLPIRDRIAVYLLGLPQVRLFWLQFGIEKSLGQKRFPRPSRRADEPFSILEFVPYLAWQYIRLAYSKLRHQKA